MTAVGPVVFARESWLQDGNKTRKYWSLDTNSGLGTVRTEAEQAPLNASESFAVVLKGSWKQRDERCSAG